MTEPEWKCKECGSNHKVVDQCFRSDCDGGWIHDGSYENPDPQVAIPEEHYNRCTECVDGWITYCGDCGEVAEIDDERE